jgi:hypothetical protein
MDVNLLPELLNLGTNGLTLFLVWSLIRMNEKLLSEVGDYNNLLLDIINRLMEAESARGMTRRTDRSHQKRD